MKAKILDGLVYTTKIRTTSDGQPLVKSFAYVFRDFIWRDRYNKDRYNILFLSRYNTYNTYWLILE